MRVVRITSANTNSLDRAWADQRRYVVPGGPAIVQSHQVRPFPIWSGAPSASQVRVRDCRDDSALWVVVHKALLRKGSTMSALHR